MLASKHKFCHPSCKPINHILLVIALLAIVIGSPSHIDGQDTDKSIVQDRTFAMRVGVEEVRIDAVALDKKGKQVPDLTLHDFEIYQDNQRQQLISCYYVSQTNVHPDTQMKTGHPINSSIGQTVDAGMGRAIVFLIDDLSMDFVQLHYTRLSLRNFVESQMQSGDQIAVMRTSNGIGALQLFTANKKQLSEIIGQLKSARWSSNSLGSSLDAQILSMRYCIHGLNVMPGRKSVIIMTSQTTLPDMSQDPHLRQLYLEQYTRLADEALRNSVVIHTLDIRGLEAPGYSMASAFTESAGRPVTPIDVMARERTLRDLHNASTEIPLSKKTGGRFLKDSNFFMNGIGQANEDLKGYYLLSYIPPESTFSALKKDVYHRIRISSKRSGIQIQTREGFYAFKDAGYFPTEGQNTLQQAIFSPFQYNDLTVRMTSGYLNDAQQGYLLQCWLNVGSDSLMPVMREDGTYSISLETAGVTSDINGFILDSGNGQYEIRGKPSEISDLNREGINLSLSIPAKKPGPYYMRVVVRDKASGKTGSAYQFLEIPDLSKQRLALSSIYVTRRNHDAPKSKALRVYSPGERIDFMAIIYNSIFKGLTPDLLSQIVVLKEGNEILRSQLEPVDLNGVNDVTRIPIAKSLVLDSSMPPGDYVLQLLVKNMRAPKSGQTATQSLGFAIAAQ